ncbi:MAG: hypothetical protein IJW44_00700, partial [Clostridia bacterium]|nr:hypothetical protein [Clostridia bacterium]
AISMGKGGASIRIDPDVEDAGLRFKGYVSTEAIAALKEEFGADATVSYGMLITPTLFAEKAGGFTADKLDTWAGSAAMKDQFGTDKAYVDVVATPDTWYKGETGLFAASLNGIQNMLTTAFSGRAYIKVAVNGNTVCTLYAAYADANNSRVFTEILSLALRDVLYTNDNGTTWYTDEACTTAPDLTMVDPAKYTTNLSEETATVKKYTCYTKAQYDDLTTLSGRISQ